MAAAQLGLRDLMASRNATSLLSAGQGKQQGTRVTSVLFATVVRAGHDHIAKAAICCVCA
jgi:hypothetical protein